MISVVLVTRDSAAILAQTLAALVPAAVDGLVKEVIVVDAGSTDATLEIAEDAGARIISLDGDVGTRLAAGCAAARGRWVLAIAPDASLPESWRGSAEAHLVGSGSRSAWLAEAGFLGLTGSPLAVLATLSAIETSGGFTAGGQPLKNLLGRIKPRPVLLRPK